MLSLVPNAQWNGMQYSANHSKHLYFTYNSEETMRNLAVWFGMEVLYCDHCWEGWRGSQSIISVLLKIYDLCNYKQLHFLFVATLEDSHILLLCEHITSEQDLRELGTNVLGVPERIIDTALHNHRNSSINGAAHDVLSTWRKKCASSEKAFMDLQAGLKRAQRNELAALLRKWAGGTDDPNERKLLKLCPTCN